ncbi:hypothetical protein D9M68_513890 [compost metagenome]
MGAQYILHSGHGPAIPIDRCGTVPLAETKRGLSTGRARLGQLLQAHDDAPVDLAGLHPVEDLIDVLEAVP